MQLSFGKFCAFFPGDIDVEQEAPILPKVKAFCPVYKWPYHGKAGPQPSILYDRLHPADVIISVGKNDAGFPSPTAITRISLSKARLWRTDSGNIFLNATLGGNYSIKIIK
jgi:beta-lactamase superfamily II metal-dependent hydrolase